jgi:hypothetical protein
MRVRIFKVEADKQSGEEWDFFRRIGLVWEGVCAMMSKWPQCARERGRHTLTSGVKRHVSRVTCT